jgi:hypothetical protein
VTVRRRQALAALGGTVLAGLVDATATAGPAYAADEVYFQNRGSVEGWSSAYTQKHGVIATVDSPVYKGAHSLRATQTYIGETGGYHSEVIRRGAQSVGEDKYYGQAVRLAPDWQFHDQNVTFQQWSPEDPEGPWLLMFVIGDELRFGGSGGIKGTVGSIAARNPGGERVDLLAGQRPRRAPAPRSSSLTAGPPGGCGAARAGPAGGCRP